MNTLDTEKNTKLDLRREIGKTHIHIHIHTYLYRETQNYLIVISLNTHFFKVERIIDLW